MVRLLLATVGLFTGYHAMLVLTPLYLAGTGASEIAIGAATGAFMLFAVGGHIAAPPIVSRYGTRWPFAAVLAGTALAAAAQSLTAAVPLILLVSALRGAAYGIGAVVSATAVAFAASIPRRAMALARYGSAAALPGVVASTLAVYVAEEVGFVPAFLGVAVLTVAAVPLLRDSSGNHPVVGGDHLLAPLSATAISAAFLFSGFAMVYGAALTFVPVQLSTSGAAAYPFVLGTAFGLVTLRWLGGAAVTAIGPAWTFAAGLTLGGSAMALLGAVPPSLAILAGLAFGGGFGLGATATHSILTTTTEHASLGKANAVFNVSWSGGMGIGAVLFGLVAELTDVKATYALAAAWHLVLAAGLAAWWVAASRDPGRRHL
jgi:MFS family permease